MVPLPPVSCPFSQGHLFRCLCLQAVVGRCKAKPTFKSVPSCLIPLDSERFAVVQCCPPSTSSQVPIRPATASFPFHRRGGLRSSPSATSVLEGLGTLKIFSCKEILGGICSLLPSQLVGRPLCCRVEDGGSPTLGCGAADALHRCACFRLD